MAIVCGFNKTTCLTEDGKLYAWGTGGAAQLGLYGPTKRPVPLLVGFPHVVPDHNFVMIAAGWNHYAALDDDGTVWTWGTGLSGVLGHGDEADRMTPTRLDKTVFGGSSAVMVACGTTNTMVVTADGRLWAFGNSLSLIGLVDNFICTFPSTLIVSVVPRTLLECPLNEVKISMVAGGRYSCPCICLLRQYYNISKTLLYARLLRLLCPPPRNIVSILVFDYMTSFLKFFKL